MLLFLSKQFNELYFIKRTNPNSPRRNDTFSIRQVSSSCYGTKPLSFLGPKIWELVPSEIKQSHKVLKYLKEE